MYMGTENDISHLIADIRGNKEQEGDQALDCTWMNMFRESGHPILTASGEVITKDLDPNFSCPSDAYHHQSE